MDEIIKDQGEYRKITENPLLPEEVEVPVFQNIEDFDGNDGIQWLRTQLLRLGDLKDRTAEKEIEAIK